MKAPIKGLSLKEPEVMEKKRMGGVGIGLILLVMGAPFLLAAWFGFGEEDKDPAARFALGALGLSICGLALFLILFRRGTTLELGEGVVVQWWGVIVPLRRQVLPLGEFKRVTLKEHERIKKNKRPVYAVRIEGDHHPAVEVDAPDDYNQARAEAEAVASFLKFPLVDSTSGTEVVREPDQLDEPLRERLRRDHQKAFTRELPPAPENLKTRVEDRGEALYLEIPPLGLTPFHYLQLLGVVLFTLIVLAFFLPQFIGDSETVDYIFLGFVSVFLLMPILFTLVIVWSSSSARSSITASPAGLRVELKGLLRTRVIEIPADELEELTMPADLLTAQSPEDTTPFSSNNPRVSGGLPDDLSLYLRNFLAPAGLTARSDTESVTFGQGLPPQEIKYLQALILRAITR